MDYTWWWKEEFSAQKGWERHQKAQGKVRFVYVDEVECIGCTYCAQIARNTFFMEDFAGRARAFAQGQDDPETVMEAIDSCPVKCVRARHALSRIGSQIVAHLP